MMFHSSKLNVDCLMIYFLMKCISFVCAIVFTKDEVYVISANGRLMNHKEPEIHSSVESFRKEQHYRETVIDSSPLSTFVIAILLIVYASFRFVTFIPIYNLCVNIELKFLADKKLQNQLSPFRITKASKKEKMEIVSSCVSHDEDDITFENDDPSNGNHSVFQTIDSRQAMCLPVGTSVALLLMFLFDFMQIIFMIGTTLMALSAFAYFTHPICQYLMMKLSFTDKVSVGFCGRCSPAELLSFSFSTLLVTLWVLTGHWLLLNALSAGLCVAMIAVLRLPSLKVSCVLLIGLLLYDVFWVFFSSYLFKFNVMLKVATIKADNPVKFLARKFNWRAARNAPKLSLPGKLIFPNRQTGDMSNSTFTMLGLGDVVVPGLLLCFVLRFDKYKKKISDDFDQSVLQRIRYFDCTLFGYFVGLVISLVVANVKQTAQPALLYLVPCTTIPLVVMAYFKGDLKQMWNAPFSVVAQRINV